MDDGNPPLPAKYYLLGCPRGLPTIHSATSARRCKTLNDRSGTQLVDILIRLVARAERFADQSRAFPRPSARECPKRKKCRRIGGLAERFRTKKKDPGNVRGPLSNFVLVRPSRHRFRCRRRPRASRTNPSQISCWHCSRRTVNGAYTLISKVNRVLTMFGRARLLPIWQSGGAAVGGVGKAADQFRE